MKTPVKIVKVTFANLLARIYVRTLVKLIVKLNAKAAKIVNLLANMNVKIVKEMYANLLAKQLARYLVKIVKEIVNHHNAARNFAKHPVRVV